MKPYFTLGISNLPDDLDTMEFPGFYWISTESETVAEKLSSQVLAALPETTQTILIYTGQKSETLLDTITQVPRNQIPLFSLPETKSALFCIPDEIQHFIQCKNCFIVLYTHTKLWENFTETELSKWVFSINQWVTRNNITLLVINRGKNPLPLKALLKGDYRFLLGLSEFIEEENAILYNVHWWGSHKGIFVNQRLYLTYKNHGLEVSGKISHESIHEIYHDEDKVLVVQSILPNLPHLSDKWEIFPTNEVVISEAMNYQAATVILSLNESSEIYSLCHQIYTLRSYCGNALKIVIREMNNKIRSADEEILLNSGATLCVPFCVVFPKILVMIQNMRGQFYNRELPDNIDLFISSLTPISQKGYLHPSEFIKQVKKRVENEYYHEDERGVLVELRHSTNVKTNQILSLCEIKREGDIITAVPEMIYLYLSMCNLSDVQISLKNLFQLPVEELFINQINVDDHQKILAVLKRISDLVKNQRQPKYKIHPSEIENKKDHEKIEGKPTPIDIILKPNKKRD